MSPQPAPVTPIARNSQVAKLLVALGLCVVALMASAAWAQDPDALDTQPPLPKNDDKQAQLAAKYAIPGRTDSAIFNGHRLPNGEREGGIENFKPIATEKENSDEYQAWNTVVSHAKAFTAAELEAAGTRDLTRDDLLNMPSRYNHRLDLVRLDGKLVRVRWAKATKVLAEGGTAKVYEAQFVPVDEPPGAVVSLVFTDLPPELAAVDQKAAGEWMAATSDVSAAGYFFKVVKDAPGPEYPQIPLLIGRSVTVHKAGPPTAAGNGPAADPKDAIPLDKNLRVFRFIRDNAPIATADQNWEEASAWNRVLLHARRFLPADLEAAATQRKFADLFTDGRRDLKLDLVKVEGRLIMLNKMKPSEKLQAAGVEAAYEGWIVPKDEPRGNPVCVVFTDPVEGLDGVTGRVNKWVTFAGYSFKLMWYQSGERDKNDKNVTKKAPLLLGRAALPGRDPDGTAAVSWSGFVPLLTGGIIGLLAIVLALAWWFRRGDSRTRQELDSHRGKNPFGGVGPAVS
jgi:hypothetical protein